MSSLVNGHIWYAVYHNGIQSGGPNGEYDWQCVKCNETDWLSRNDTPPENWHGECPGEDLSTVNDIVRDLEIEALNQRIGELEKTNLRLKARLQVWDKNDRYDGCCE